MFVGAATFFVVMGILVGSSESAFLALSRSDIALFLTIYAVISLGAGEFMSVIYERLKR